MRDIWKDELAPTIRASYFADPSKFQQKKIIRQTMCGYVDRGLAQICWDRMKAGGFLTEEVLRALPASFGTPVPFSGYPAVSAPSVIHAYHLFEMLRGGVDVQQASHVVEFGAGFGNLCRIVHQLGFSGVYSIIDLEPMCDIQRDYLAHTLGTHGVQWINEVPALESGLFIATSSLNETPAATRRHVESAIVGYDALYFAYTAAWHGSDEFAYFEGLQKQLPTFAWNMMESRPNGRRRFLLGVRGGVLK